MRWGNIVWSSFRGNHRQLVKSSIFVEAGVTEVNKENEEKKEGDSTEGDNGNKGDKKARLNQIPRRGVSRFCVGGNSF